MKRTLIFLICVTIFNIIGECQSDKSEKFTISGNGMLGLSWYKPSSPLHKEDLSDGFFLPGGWGLGSIKGTAGIGLKVSYELFPLISIGSGIYANWHGSDIVFSLNKTIDIYYSSNLGYATVGQITPLYLSGNTQYNRFHLNKRTYQTTCFMVPVNIKFLVTPLKIKRKLAVYGDLGFRYYKITACKISDYIGNNVINGDNILDMATHFFSICPGAELEIDTRKKAFVSFMVQFERGMGSVLKSPSIYLVDSELTETSFKNGGKAIPINQSARKNSFNIQVGFGKRI